MARVHGGVGLAGIRMRHEGIRPGVGVDPRLGKGKSGGDASEEETEQSECHPARRRPEYHQEQSSQGEKKQDPAEHDGYREQGMSRS